MRVKNNHDEEHPNLRGSRLWKQGDLLGAEESFLASIERNPESDTGYGILTGFYLEQGEFKKARATLKEWKEKTPLRFRASYHIMWAQILSSEAIHEVIAERSEHKKQSALFHLKAAIDAGFDNDGIILKEPKLEYIRDTPEFWELIGHNLSQRHQLL